MFKKIQNIFKILHDSGVFLFGLAAIIALFKTDVLLDKITKIQSQTLIIESLVRDLQAMRLVENSKVNGVADKKFLIQSIEAFNEQNTVFEFENKEQLIKKLQALEPKDIDSSILERNLKLKRN